MKVSVIIPFFSNIGWLTEAVESVISQTFSDYEIIVINDGSPEDVNGFIDKYQEKIHYFKTENKGAAHARNYGIKRAKGDYLAFLDSDDLWLEEKLEKQLKFMLDTSSVWSHTNYLTFDDETQNELSHIQLGEYSGCIYPRSLASAHIATPSVIVKREVLLQNRLFFQEVMRFGEDYYLWLKLSQLYRLDLVPEYLLKVRVRGANAASRARAHIHTRGKIWDLLKDDTIFAGVRYKYLFRLAYWICSIENRQLLRIEGKFNRVTIERMSKALYFLPYVMFKLLFFISTKND